QLTDDFVRSPQVQALIPHVTTITTMETMEGSAFAPSESVDITLTDGTVLPSGPVMFAKGSRQRPLSTEELRIKFVDCLGPDIPDEAKAHTFDKLMNLERVDGAADLFQLT